MNRLLTVACLTILISTGCDSPSTSVSNSSNGVTQQPTSRLKQTTVDNVALKPSQPTPGLELLIPDGFSLMDESVIATKYPAGNRPTLVYTNATGAINIAINHTQNRILPNQLKQLHQQLDTSIRQSQPTAKWMFSGFQHYHGREWGLVAAFCRSASRNWYDPSFRDNRDNGFRVALSTKQNT